MDVLAFRPNRPLPRLGEVIVVYPLVMELRVAGERGEHVPYLLQLRDIQEPVPLVLPGNLGVKNPGQELLKRSSAAAHGNLSAFLSLSCATPPFLHPLGGVPLPFPSSSLLLYSYSSLSSLTHRSPSSLLPFLSPPAVRND